MHIDADWHFRKLRQHPPNADCWPNDQFRELCRGSSKVNLPPGFE
jgi:hypothetical protein